jgi:hypothetical protein
MMLDVMLVTVTVISLAFASAMGLITWRVLRQDRRRSDARVADLSAAADADEDAIVAPAAALPAGRYAMPQVPVAAAPETDADPLWTDLVEASLTETALRPHDTPLPELFVPQEPMRSNGRRMVLAVGLGSAMVLVVFAVVLALNARPAASGTGARAAARVAAPLELVVLDHARAGGHLSIHGLVRNPRSGSEVRDLNAVVFLFDRDGGYIATVQAPVLEHDLVPGGESTFEVPVESGQRVARYRLTFRAAAAPVPHVDRRAPVPAAAPAATRAAVVAQAALAGAPAERR